MEEHLDLILRFKTKRIDRIKDWFKEDTIGSIDHVFFKLFAENNKN